MHFILFLNDILSMSYFYFVYKFPPLWQARARLLRVCVSLTVALRFYMC